MKKRWLPLLLTASLCLNIFLVAYVAAVGFALSHPQKYIHGQLDTLVAELPEQYRPKAQDQLDQFYKQNVPLMRDIAQERQAFYAMLLDFPVDTSKAQQQAAKIRAMSARIQEAIQTAAIEAMKDIPREEKTRLVENNRMLKTLSR